MGFILQDDEEGSVAVAGKLKLLSAGEERAVEFAAIGEEAGALAPVFCLLLLQLPGNCQKAAFYVSRARSHSSTPNPVSPAAAAKLSLRVHCSRIGGCAPVPPPACLSCIAVTISSAR